MDELKGMALEWLGSCVAQSVYPKNIHLQWSPSHRKPYTADTRTARRVALMDHTASTGRHSKDEPRNNES